MYKDLFTVKKHFLYTFLAGGVSNHFSIWTFEINLYNFEKFGMQNLDTQKFINVNYFATSKHNIQEYFSHLYIRIWMNKFQIHAKKFSNF